MKNTRSLLPLAAAFLAAVACGWTARAAAPDNPPGGTPKARYTYALTSGDTIRVDILGEDPMAPQHIDTLGNVTLPLVGDFHVAGMTRDGAQQAIADAYVSGRFIRHPEVTVSIDDYAPREVSIQGMVKNPGRYPLPVETAYSVVELVTKAGGFTDIAKGTDVSIIRSSPGKGKPQVFHVNVEAIFKGKGNVKQDDPSLQLLPGDIVYVPEAII